MRAEIARLRNGADPLPEIECKTVETLWHACDVPEMGLSQETELELLGQWVEMLYDRETRASLELASRVDADPGGACGGGTASTEDIRVTSMPVMSVDRARAERGVAAVRVGRKERVRDEWARYGGRTNDGGKRNRPESLVRPR